MIDPFPKEQALLRIPSAQETSNFQGGNYAGA
jgi:hypothetical protein